MPYKCDDSSVAVWMPSTRRGTVPLAQALVIERAQGVYATDIDGREYIDLNSGLWNAGFGYGNPVLVDSACTAMRALSGASLFNRYHTLALQLADRLSRLLPGRRYFFCCSGSEAVDTAVRLSFMRSTARRDERLQVASLPGAYHGMTLASLSLGQIEGYAGGLPQVLHSRVLPDPWKRSGNASEELREFFGLYGKLLAAVAVEFVQGSGGVRELPQEYWKVLRREATAHGVLIIGDEVTTGLYRSGDRLASDRYYGGVDIILLGKQLTGGLAALSVVAVTQAVFEEVVGCPATERLGGFTFGGHPVACAVATAVLELVETDAFRRQCSRGAEVLRGLVADLSEVDGVAKVRGLGHMWGVELERNVTVALGGDSRWAETLRIIAQKRGVLVHPLAAGVVPLMPALTSSPRELEIMVAALTGILEEARQGCPQ